MADMDAARQMETVLIDIDGTLVDSNDAHARAWAEAFRVEGIDVGYEHIRRCIGMGGDKLLPQVAGIDADSERGRALSRRKKAAFEALLPGLMPTRGARQLVEYVLSQGAHVVVATSAGGDEADALLERAGVADLIPRRTSKDDADQSKPEPDIIIAALRKAGAQPETSVMIGDTPYDIEASGSAGVRAIALRCGGYWQDDAFRGAAGIYDDPAHLLEHWRDSADQLSV